MRLRVIYLLLILCAAPLSQLSAQIVPFGFWNRPSTTGGSYNISSSTTNVNLYTLAGSPGTAGTYVFVINSGVTVGSTSTATAAIITGTWPSGSNIVITNNGNIYGKEGAGGSSGGNGFAGGPALSVSHDVTINNTNGNIWGGGGGGGGGGSGQNTGGGGGAGQGYGNQGAPGNGASGSYWSNGAEYPDTYAVWGGTGGNGGTWGMPGAAGSASGYMMGIDYFSGGDPHSAGAAGDAIALNGNAVTWLGGNSGTQVKGLVQ